MTKVMSLEKFKTYAAYFWGMCACLYGGYTFFYENDKWHLFLFSIVLYGLLYALFKLIRKTTWSWLRHGISFIILYSAVLAIFFSSSFLQIKEFQLIHPNWVLADQVQINDVEIDDYRHRRSLQYAYTRVKYTYQLNAQMGMGAADKLDPQYMLWFFETSPALKAIAEQKTNQAMHQQQYSVYVNAQNPSQSRFFLNQRYFELRNSGFAWLIFSLQMLFLVLVLILAIMLWDAFTDSKRSKTSKKSKTKRQAKALQAKSDTE